MLLALYSCREKPAESTQEMTNDAAAAKQQEQADQPQPAKNVLVLIETPYGNMKVRLYDKTPRHRDNFIKLIRQGWYDNSPFHRVINGFMIQGGQKADGKEDPGYTVPAEFVQEFYHKKGALAAARLGDHVNPNKASSGCQFYIVQGKKISAEELNNLDADRGTQYSGEQKEMYMKTGGTPFLDYNYSVFGEVVEGLEVIDKIAAVKTGQEDKPVKDVRMKITLIENQ